jgi:hypothetical protein
MLAPSESTLAGATFNLLLMVIWFALYNGKCAV